MSDRTWAGLANHPIGVLQFPSWDITYSMESLTFEFEEEDTQQTTDIFLTLHEGANLISIPLTTESWNSTLNNGTPIPSNVIAILTEGTACTYVDGLGWVGSLTAIESHRGYWLSLIHI